MHLEIRIIKLSPAAASNLFAEILIPKQDLLVQLGQHGTFSQPLYMEASLVFLLFSPLLGLLPSFSPAKSKTLSEDPRTTLLVKLNFLQL